MGGSVTTMLDQTAKSEAKIYCDINPRAWNVAAIAKTAKRASDMLRCSE